MTTCPSGHPTQSTDYCDVCGMPIPPGGPAPSPSVAPPAQPVPATMSGPSGPGGPAQGVPPQVVTCPNCQVPNSPDALFCEACGYDFTTGTMPRMPSEEDDTPTNEQPAVGPDGLPLTPPADPAESAAPSADGADADPGTDPGIGPPAPGENGVDRLRAATESPSQPKPAPPRPAAEWVAEVWVDPDWYRTQNSPDPLPSPGLPEVVLLTDPSILVGRVSQSRNIHPQIDCGNDSGVSRRHAQLTGDSRRWWVEDLQSSNGTFVAPASGPLPKNPIDPGERVELNPDDRVYVGGWTRMVIRRATDEEKSAG